MTPCHDDEPARDGQHFITQYQLLDDSSGDVLHFPIKSAATENFFLTQPKPVKLSHSQCAPRCTFSFVVCWNCAWGRCCRSEFQVSLFKVSCSETCMEWIVHTFRLPQFRCNFQVHIPWGQTFSSTAAVAYQFSSNQFVVEGKAAFHENISCSVCLECRLWSTVVKVEVILLMPEILRDQRETSSRGKKSSSLKKFEKNSLA